MADEVVVIIDVQNGILEDGSGSAPPVENARALDVVVERIAQMLGTARKLGVPVVFVQHSEPGSSLEHGTKGWQIRDEIAPEPGEPVVEKTACDSFFETTLQDELVALDAKKLIVAGCQTQYCVDTSVRRAVSLGYDVVLVGDAHMTTNAGRLTFDEIIAHHNRTLNGFGAGAHAVSVLAAEEVGKSF
jgi:nicotinamidase-related amidase